MNLLMIFALTMCAFFLIYPHWKRRTIIKRWYHSLNLPQHLATHQHLYQTVDGFALSKRARLIGDAMEYTYGEIDFVSYIALLSLTNPNPSTVFYDLGSGIGKAVIASAMVFKMQKCCGIELFELLHQQALHQLTLLKEMPDYRDKADIIQFIHKDFLLADFNDATLIFVNATAYFGETWERLMLRLKQMSSETLIITTSKKLPPDAFTLLSTTTVRMSWGLVSAYIQRPIA